MFNDEYPGLEPQLRVQRILGFKYLLRNQNTEWNVQVKMRQKQQINVLTHINEDINTIMKWKSTYDRSVTKCH